uniref:Uncharacterized protein n=1 Tax=Solanum tuberosum TaxID=4113 RepID=M1DNZ7_SOLTU
MTFPNRKGVANVISDYSRFVATLFDHLVGKVKRKLVRETTIKRARVDMVDAAVKADVNIDVGVGVSVGAGGDGKRVRPPLVVDFLNFYVRSARNKMTMLSSIFTH